jgi:hypothetical protein
MTNVKTRTRRQINALPKMLSAFAIFVVGCTSKQSSEQTGTEFYYLGIPLHEEYPDSRFKLDPRVPPNKYWLVTKVEHVTREVFERDVSAGKAIFREQHGGTEYYTTEVTGDFSRHDGVREWVTMLKRKDYP